MCFINSLFEIFKNFHTCFQWSDESLTARNSMLTICSLLMIGVNLMKKFKFCSYFLMSLFFIQLASAASASLWQVEDDHSEEFKIRRSHIECVDSTQTQIYDMLDNLMRGNPSVFKGIFGRGLSLPFKEEMLVLTAESQTSGIGSSTRQWYSPIGGVYMTAVIPWPAEKLHLAVHLSQVSNVSVCEVLEQYGLRPQIKWVNDTILNDKKCAGTLCRLYQDIPFADENSGKEERSFAVVVGIGVNVNMQEKDAEQKYHESIDSFKVPYTSMSMESDCMYSVDSVLGRIIDQLNSNVSLLLRNGNFQGDFLGKIKKRLAYVDSIVAYSDDTGSPKKIFFYGVNDAGQMVSSDGVKSCGRIRPTKFS